MTEQTLSVECGAPFKWPRGLSLSAPIRVRIVLPGTLVKEGETIGSIIELSDDDAHIGFQEAKDGSDGFACIVLELEQGASVRLHRASEAVVFSDSEGPIIFRAETESHAS